MPKIYQSKALGMPTTLLMRAAATNRPMNIQNKTFKLLLYE